MELRTLTLPETCRFLEADNGNNWTNCPFGAVPWRSGELAFRVWRCAKPQIHRFGSGSMNYWDARGVDSRSPQATPTTANKSGRSMATNATTRPVRIFLHAVSS